MAKMKTLEQIKKMLSANQAESAKRADDAANGICQRTFKIINIEGDTATAKNGRDYDRVVVTYRDMERDNLQEKRMAIWDPQAELIVSNAELDKTYVVDMAKDEGGFWKWTHLELVADKAA